MRPQERARQGRVVLLVHVLEQHDVAPHQARLGLAERVARRVFREQCPVPIGGAQGRADVVEVALQTFGQLAAAVDVEAEFRNRRRRSPP